MTMTKKRHGKKGFTLVELIVVIAILAILAAILIPLVSGYISDANEAKGAANARTVYAAACAYVAKEGAAGRTVANGTISQANMQSYLGSGLAANSAAATVAGGEVTQATWTDGVTVWTFAGGTVTSAPKS